MMGHKMALAVLVALAVTVSGAGVAAVAAQDAPPQPPASYYGDVSINGSDATSGTEITAWIDGDQVGSIEIESDGSYGGSQPGDAKLHARCDACDGGEDVTFKVHTGTDRETSAQEMATFQSGQVMRQDLTFQNVPAPSTPSTPTETPTPTPTASPTPSPTASPTPSPTPTTTEAPGGGSGGSGGSGGGSGGGATTPAPSTSTPGPVTPSPPEVVNITDDDPDRPGITVNVSSVSQAVESITFSNDSAGASVTITENPSSPAQVSDEVSNDVGANVNVVSSVEITPSGSSDVSAEVTFRVPVGDVGGPDLVTVFHKPGPDASWAPTNTTYEGDRGGNHVFTAGVESFSTFAVGETTDDVDSTETPTTVTDTVSTTVQTVRVDTDTHTIRTPTPGQDGPGFGFVVSIFALLAAAILALRRA